MKKSSRRQALKDQDPLELPKDKHGASRSPAAPVSMTTSSSLLKKRAASLTPKKTQPPTFRPRHLVNEPSDEDIQILGAIENPHAPWLNDNFVMPDNRKDCFLLAKKVGEVETLGKMDIYALEGPKVLVGGGILQRIAQIDKDPEMMSLGSSYIANRTGLLLSELATNVVAMDNLVTYHRELKEEAEQKLSQSKSDLKGISNELVMEKQSFRSLTVHLSDMEGKMTQLELNLELLKARVEELKRQVASLSNEAVIDEYKASPAFQAEWVSRVLPYYLIRASLIS